MRVDEMRMQHEAYHRQLEAVRGLIRQKKIEEAVQKARGALEYVDGMQRLARKKDKTKKVRVYAIELLLNHAPTVFDRSAIDAVADFLAAKRGVARKLEKDFSPVIEKSYRALRLAQAMWELVSRTGGVEMKRLRVLRKGSVHFFDRILENWREIGLVQVEGDPPRERVSSVSQLTARIVVRFPCCGGRCIMTKETYLTTNRCPSCQSSAEPVLISESLPLPI